jgi:hypothetical protein
MTRVIGAKRDFYDAHERRAYERAIRLANSLVETPSLLDAGIRFLERFMGAESSQADVYQAWMTLLRRSPADVASALVEDSDYGRFLRETAPSFRSLTEEEAAATRRLFP